MHALPLSHPFMARRSHAHPLSELHAPPSPGPEASGLRTCPSLPPPRPTGWEGGRSVSDRQGQLVSGEEGSCAPGPGLSPPLPLSLGPPAQARQSHPSAVEFPQRPPLKPDGVGEQARAGVGGNSPPPPPGPDSSESSDLPAAPAAGCPQGLGGGQRRCVGGRGPGRSWVMTGAGGQSGLASPRCPAPQSSLPIPCQAPHQAVQPGSAHPLTLPALRRLPTPAPNGWHREDSRKAKVSLVVMEPAKTSNPSWCLRHKPGEGPCVWQGQHSKGQCRVTSWGSPLSCQAGRDWAGSSLALLSTRWGSRSPVQASPARDRLRRDSSTHHQAPFPFHCEGAQGLPGSMASSWAWAQGEHPEAVGVGHGGGDGGDGEPPFQGSPEERARWGTRTTRTPHAELLSAAGSGGRTNSFPGRRVDQKGLPVWSHACECPWPAWPPAKGGERDGVLSFRTQAPR